MGKYWRAFLEGYREKRRERKLQALHLLLVRAEARVAAAQAVMNMAVSTVPGAIIDTWMTGREEIALLQAQIEELL